MTGNRTLMCQSTWPESDSQDFKVFDLDPDETKEEAILRAQKSYNVPAEQFYIVTEGPPLEFDMPDYESRMRARDCLEGKDK